MELEEISSMSIAPAVVSPFAIDWSEDGYLSILTEKGVHIFELAPSPTSVHPTLKFHRSFIYPPDINPGDIFTEKIGTGIWNLERDDVFPLFMQEELTPNLNGLTPIQPKITKVSWSPRNIVYPNRCLIAILTSAGCCLILREIGTEWYIVFNLSELKSKKTVNDEGNGIHCMEKSNCNKREESCTVRKDLKIDENDVTLEQNKKDTKTQTLATNLENTKTDEKPSDHEDPAMTVQDAKSLANTVLATAVAWSTNWNPCYIIVAYRCKIIMIYTIPRIHDNDTVVPKIVGQVQVEEIINHICWITINTESFLILLSDLKGNISGYVFDNAQESVILKRKEVYYAYGDRIMVKGMSVVSENDKTIVIAIKGSFICILTFNQNKEFLSMKCLQVDGFSISGITKVAADQVLFTTDNGILYYFKAQDFVTSKIKVENSLHQSKQRILGVTISPSAALIVYVVSPANIYDHLVTREPSRLIFLAPKAANPMTVLISNRSQSLDGVWDNLELLRIRAARTLKLPEVPKDLECLSRYELRIFLWISIMTETCLKKAIVKNLCVADDEFEAQSLIFLHSTCDFLEKVLQKEILSKEERMAVRNIGIYLEVFLAAEETGKASERAEKMLTTIRLKTKEEGNELILESCSLCDAAINEVPWKATRCTQGHILPRCGLTLLQIPTVDQKVCKICQQIFHPLVGNATCLYCDMPVVADTRVTGVFMGVGKSLSRKLRNDISEASEKELL